MYVYKTYLQYYIDMCVFSLETTVTYLIKIAQAEELSAWLWLDMKYIMSTELLSPSVSHYLRIIEISFEINPRL